MTPRATAALAVAMLAVGILVGAAGAVVVRDATGPDMAWLMTDHMAAAGTMPMMDASMMGPGASMAPADHGAHHPAGIGNPVP